MMATRRYSLRRQTGTETVEADHAAFAQTDSDGCLQGVQRALGGGFADFRVGGNLAAQG